MPRKRRRKAKGRLYWTQETQDAIIRYNNEEDELTREKIGNYSLKDSLTISEFEKNLMRDIS